MHLPWQRNSKQDISATSPAFRPVALPGLPAKHARLLNSMTTGAFSVGICQVPAGGGRYKY